MATEPRARSFRRQQPRPSPSRLTTTPSLLLPTLLLSLLAHDSSLSLAFASPAVPPPPSSSSSSSWSLGSLWGVMVCVYACPDPHAGRQQRNQPKTCSLFFIFPLSLYRPRQSRSPPRPSSSRLFAGVEPDEPVPFSSRQMSAVRALEVRATIKDLHARRHPFCFGWTDTEH